MPIPEHSDELAMSDSVFTRILRREIPAAMVHEDDRVFAFMDAGQVNPGHVLVATRRQVETLVELKRTRPPTCLWWPTGWRGRCRRRSGRRA
jgi:hypothetical protein